MGARPFDVARTRLTLFQALLRARQTRGGGFPILEDADRNPLTYDTLIAAAFALGAKLKAELGREETPGIMLPTSIACSAALLAFHTIGRAPAMLNFTAGTLNLRAACRTARVQTILTSRRFIEAAKLQSTLEDLSLHARFVFLEDIRAQIGPLDRLAAFSKAKAARYVLPEGDPDDVAVVLFTSGSYGSPKGVALTHANLIANCEQCFAQIPFEPDWFFFCPLPMFHSFGLMAGLIVPALTGHRSFLYPSPVQAKEIVRLVRESGANVFFATDTFAQQYARAAADEDLANVRIMVLGAERIRDETRDTYARRFGTELLETYGATEASPVISINVPGAENRPGTVGRILPALEWRLEPVPGVERGQRLFVRGPNVMRGYTDPSLPSGVGSLEGGWHDTGDVVEVDADGYLHILGRVKRFAKIGGEIVSLNAIEDYAQHIWPGAMHAAIAVEDERKGQRIVLFTDDPAASVDAFLAWAKTQGVADIAVPKRIVKMDAIPILGTGKTDYAALERIGLP